jgi:dihydrofolate reductase
MICSVFIATSADGYIASQDGGVDWLETAGNQEADMGAQSDMGFNSFIASVDCMIMGRKSMEKISSFNISPEQWPYGGARIFALSGTLQEVPDNLKGRVEIFSGDIAALVSLLDNEGYTHAYVDGGATITSFLNLQLINEMTITQAPILLGKGRPLFGTMPEKIRLQGAQAIAYPNGFVQIKYQVSYR